MTKGNATGFDHLAAMSDHRGLMEHADGTAPRIEHGYCTDDNARLLVVAAREADTGTPAALGRVALAFTLASQLPDGRFHNRMSASGAWTDRATTDDCWGRGLWGLGVAATHHRDPAVRAAASAGFDAGVDLRSRWPRAMAFAALGAGEILAVNADHAGARDLLQDAVKVVGEPSSGAWAWPEPKLTYANAALAEATMLAGAVLTAPAILAVGLAMLEWLLAREAKSGHLSVTGVGGRHPHDLGPQFDQQPIEVAAMADACWRAHTLTGDAMWARGIELCSAWFDGTNDAGAVMHDPASGGGFDGLHCDGVNRNQGAESTLALVSTRQRARSIVPPAP